MFAEEGLELGDGLVHGLGLIVQVVMRCPRHHENVFLRRARLVEQLEPVAIGAEGADLSTADDNLQRLGQKLVRKMDGVC
ncbi:hypothetical protein [Celeribacter indicus]|uniref:Uncharacterized protein n=1 Tax=Celeribacter indicus TaxID=1208324 RepID=A0A0B5E4A2_9RHOB|nr:hypothetical protein [Celeribacter indicus]AJE47886.1 hypothetical protein P73_3171 [Celeribacter indicus]SDW26032.1 hypothetical protein SAMN05443573_102160 [Celeribacter indicus]